MGHVHWPIESGTYLLRVAAYSSSQLVAFSLDWTGPRNETIAGIRILKSCSRYTAGCGLRFEFTSSNSGSCAVSVSTPLHLRVQQKQSSTIPIYDGSVPGTFVVPFAATWTGQLFSTTGADTSVSMGLSWP